MTDSMTRERWLAARERVRSTYVTPPLNAEDYTSTIDALTAAALGQPCPREPAPLWHSAGRGLLVTPTSEGVRVRIGGPTPIAPPGTVALSGGRHIVLTPAEARSLAEALPIIADYTEGQA